MHNIPRLANDLELRCSSCIAGSSDIISPLSSYLFQQLHAVHLKFRMLEGNGTGDWQKKHWMLLWRLNRAGMLRDRVLDAFLGREAVVWCTHLGQTTMLISHRVCGESGTAKSPLINIVMSIHAAPASSTSRGDLVLQPNYFTSSVYVKALRDDISTLVLRYHEAYNQPGVTQPFALFKTVWSDMGWNWLQFRVFDSRSRHTFLEVTTRLFLGMSTY